METETDKKMRRQEITVIFLAYHIDERILCFHFAFLTSTTHFSPFPIGDDTESTGLLNCFLRSLVECCLMRPYCFKQNDQDLIKNR